MDLDFFNAQPQTQSEYQPGRAPEPAQEDSQDHQDGDFNDFHSVDPQPVSSSYSNVDVNVSNIPTNFDEPIENKESFESEILEKVRQQENLLHEQLQEKAVRDI